ncbi:unnamed protein product [Candidula unifasciata]|uniref:Phosphatidylethanolamine-binding protein n=1 Tax=Candidula unifasciata TaxID=100452 RepID=A0A8S3ZW29_9EUPU|nr:unnamed protein product [Candidula unifasciata]
MMLTYNPQMLLSEMKPTVSTMAAVLAVLTFHVVTVPSQGTDEKLAQEMKCLNVIPSNQCNLEVTYGSPVGTLQCDQKVPQTQGNTLTVPPVLTVSPGIGTIRRVVMVMVDPDAPVSKTEGFVHWIADATVDPAGSVITGTEYIDYYPPTPPIGHGEHRYQFFLYRLQDDQSLNVSKSRKFSLCSFVDKNQLGKPVAATQFRFERLQTE